MSGRTSRTEKGNHLKLRTPPPPPQFLILEFDVYSPLYKREGNWAELTFAKTSGTVSREREKQLGSLCSHVFERRTSTGSEPFSLFKCLDATKSVWPNVFTLTETICPILFFKIKTQEYKKSTSGRRVSLKNVAAWTLTSTSMVTIPGVFAKADWSLLPSRF